MLIAHLPAGSATWAAEQGVPYGITPTDVILTDIFHAITGSPHPMAPRVVAPVDTGHRDMVARLRAQRERLRAQREATT